MEEVEDEEHFLLRCEGWRQGREMLSGFMDNLVGEFCMATDDRKVALILDQACSNGRVGNSKAVEKIWQRRFLQSAYNLNSCACVPCVMLVPDPNN